MMDPERFEALAYLQAITKHCQDPDYLSKPAPSAPSLEVYMEVASAMSRCIAAIFDVVDNKQPADALNPSMESRIKASELLDQEVDRINKARGL